jgi:hypothetical protein
MAVRVAVQGDGILGTASRRILERRSTHTNDALS